MRTLPPGLTHATLQKSMLRLSSKHDQANRSGRCKRFMACEASELRTVRENEWYAQSAANYQLPTYPLAQRVRESTG